MRLSQILKSCTVSLWKWFRSSNTDGKAQPISQQWELTASETSAYHRSMAKDCLQADQLDERTWSDLEMEKIFLRLNKCVTPMGAQYLYALLRRYQPQLLLAENVHAYESFKSNPETHIALRNALSKLNHRASADLADFLHGTPPSIPSGYRYFYLTSALAILCPLGLFLSPWFLLPTLLLWSLNILLYYLYGTKLSTYSPALTSLGVLLGSVPKISQAIQTSNLPELRELQISAEASNKVHQKISMAFLRRGGGGDDFSRLLIDYLNMLCLFEVSALCRAICAVNQERATLLNLFQVVARLDALQGISTVLAEYPSVCVPEIKSGRQFSLVNVQHPLITDPVPNTIEGKGNSFLLTGTNMAGKTTFIKTLAVNLLLAQTIGVCFASKAILPPARVRTLIGRDDIIASGQSYFYFEASELLRMLKDAEQSGREHWFILDEIFRGTNTLERVGAGSAVLGHLSGRGIVVASTHDHELTKLLQDEFDLYHFSEVISGKEAKFDYILRKGPCTTRNAIKLLTIAGFPNVVTDLAESYVTSVHA